MIGMTGVVGMMGRCDGINRHAADRVFGGPSGKRCRRMTFPGVASAASAIIRLVSVFRMIMTRHQGLRGFCVAMIVHLPIIGRSSSLRGSVDADWYGCRGQRRQRQDDSAL